ncbi:unnamed protein product [Closterium sp. NIES-65]|nr:unnamed protein product [Closterium sp. NIES-65]
MYAVTISAEDDCYLCVLPDPGIEAATLGASESAALGAGESALSGTARPVAVSLADPFGGPVLAHSSTVVPCPAVPSGSLSSLHLPWFSTNLVSGADLQDAWVDQFTPGGQRVTYCSCTQTGRHLAMFTRQPGSSRHTRYRAALPAEFCAKNPPPMYITLYYIVNRLPEFLRLVTNHFLPVCPTTLTVDLLKEHLLAAEKSIVAVKASCGDPHTPVFESRSALRLPLAGDAAPARAREVRALEGLAGAVEVAVEAMEGVGVVVGVVAGVEVSVAAVEAEEAAAGGGGSGGAGGGGGGGGGNNAASRGSAHSSGSSGSPRQLQQRTRETPSPQQLRDRAGAAIFDLDDDAILAAMYAVSTSDEGDCYMCVPPDPGIENAALGAGEGASLGAYAPAVAAGESALSGTTLAQALHTFTLHSGASRSFFSDRTTLTPLSQSVAVSLADPSGGRVLARFSTIFPCTAAPSSTLSGLYLPSFSTNLVSGADLQDGVVDQFTPPSQRVTQCRSGSSQYTLTSESPPVAESSHVAASNQVFAAASRD